MLKASENKDLNPAYAGGTPVRTDVVDGSTAASSAGMDPRTGAGNGDPASNDPNTAANAPETK